MKVLVTGHHGYIGSVAGPMLVEAGHDVTGLDTFFYEGCDLVPDTVEIPALRMDLREVTPETLEGFEGIVHFAALSNDPLGELDAELTREINLGGTVALARAAKEAGVGRFVFASSCSMYGASGTDDLIEEDAPLRPLTAYAESKVRAEEALHELADDDFAPVFMRNATAYGASPRFRFDVVLNNLSAWAFTTGRVLIMSDGTPWRPLVHVRDIVKAAASALVAPHALVADQAFNVGANNENYRVDFAKLERTLPEAKPVWTARDGVLELFDAFRTVGFTMDSFDSYTRLARLKALLDEGALDARLRWQHAAELA
jgi:nucleoside-diphosphate-sugar epimerase